MKDKNQLDKLYKLFFPALQILRVDIVYIRFMANDKHVFRGEYQVFQ